MRFPAEVLVLACLVVGIAPTYTVGPLLDTAARGALGTAPPAYSLAVWHGLTPELLMSALAMAGGVVVYRVLRPYVLTWDGPPLLRRVNGRRIFERLLDIYVFRFSISMESILGTRRLQPQLQLLVCIALLAGAAPLYAQGIAWVLPRAELDVAFVLVWAVGVACALGAAYYAKFHRLAALILLGGAGLVTCISFVWMSAPDLALTQLVVETVTTVLLLLGLRWLPKRIAGIAPVVPAHGMRWYRIGDLVIAVAAGSGLAALAYVIMTSPPPAGIAGYFVRNAYSGGGGTNIVNVILVDFRAFDTLGEITVLCIVALAVYALLRRFRPAPESIPVPEQQRTQDAYDAAHPDRDMGDTLKSTMAVPELIMRLLFPVIAVMAIYLLLRGHDLPGGGFVAGVTMAVAFILQYMARGTTWVEDRLRVLPVRWMGAGLLLATATGAAAWLFGRPFLTSAFSYVQIPLIGAIPVASVLLFDIGVFAAVVGATVLMLIAIAHQSVRSHRAPRGREPRPQAASPRTPEVQ
jgi:multicomponent K+:H+ antiporter subunit A